MALRLCASCSRHFRASEGPCPFCGSHDAAGVPEPLSRATRAALVFGSATLVVAGVACGGQTSGSSDSGADADGLARDATPDVTAAPPYGRPPDASPPPPPPDAGSDVNIQPPYGAPPPPDAGPDVNIQPPYGAPPPRDASRD